MYPNSCMIGWWTDVQMYCKTIRLCQAWCGCLLLCNPYELIPDRMSCNALPYTRIEAMPVLRFLFRPVLAGLTRPSVPPPPTSPANEAVTSASAATSRRQRPLHACKARPLPTTSATFAHDDVPQVATAALKRSFSSSDQLTGGAWPEGDIRPIPLVKDRGVALMSAPLLAADLPRPVLLQLRRSNPLLPLAVDGVGLLRLRGISFPSRAFLPDPVLARLRGEAEKADIDDDVNIEDDDGVCASTTSAVECLLLTM